MATTYIYALLSVLVVSLISLAGVFTLSVREEVLRKYVFILISLAVGGLLGDAVIHLIPEAFEGEITGALVSVLIVSGVLLFFMLEKFLHWHHHGEDQAEQSIHPAGKLILISDGVHNILDGVAIGISFLISVPVGIATTVAIILHEIPQEIGDFAVLLHSGYTRARALWFNFLSALGAVVGTVLALVLGEAGEMFALWVLPLTAGGFIYIAIADLMPELHKTKEVKHSLLQIAAVILGVLAMLALLYLE